MELATIEMGQEVRLFRLVDELVLELYNEGSILEYSFADLELGLVEL